MDDVRRYELAPHVSTIGVVSDTHLPRFGAALPTPLLAGLRAANVAAIFHCGDFTLLDPVIPELERIAPTIGVAGNNDGPEIVAAYGRRAVVVAGSVRMGIVHGDGNRGTTPDRAAGAFPEERMDAICFGHSHIPLEHRLPGGGLLLNPGSPTDKRRMPRYTYALLHLRADGVFSEIVAFDPP